MHDSPTSDDRPRAALLALLRLEYAAIKAYEQAIGQLGDAVPDEVSDGLISHRRRRDRLCDQLHDRGGGAEHHDSLVQILVSLAEGGAVMLGTQALLGTLEEIEDHTVAEYREQMELLDPASRRIVEAELLPEQLSAHARIRGMCHFVIEMAPAEGLPLVTIAPEPEPLAVVI